MLLVMHVSIANNLKKRFHATRAIRGLKMSQVVVKLIEEWLQVNETYSFKVNENTLFSNKTAK